jgi:hypothetical protein
MDDSSFPVTPPTHGPQPVQVDIASEIRRLRDRLAEVKAHRSLPATMAPAVMPNEYDQITKDFEDQITKEFEEQIAKKFVDKIMREFQERTDRHDTRSKQ